jgi:hypothetical protein
VDVDWNRGAEDVAPPAALDARATVEAAAPGAEVVPFCDEDADTALAVEVACARGADVAAEPAAVIARAVDVGWVLGAEVDALPTADGARDRLVDWVRGVEVAAPPFAVTVRETLVADDLGAEVATLVFAESALATDVAVALGADVETFDVAVAVHVRAVVVAVAFGADPVAPVTAAPAMAATMTSLLRVNQATRYASSTQTVAAPLAWFVAEVRP